MITSQEYKQVMAGLRAQRKLIWSSEEEGRKLFEELGIGHLYGGLPVRKKKTGGKATK